VHVVVMSPQNVPLTFEAVGQTEGSKQVEVRARVAGILQQRLYEEGTSVRAGAPLFQIDRAPFELALAQAKAALAQEQARAAQARREADRLKPLAEERAISRKDYDDAASALQLSQASVQQATAKVQEAELNLSYTRVVASVSGITGRAERSEGSLITTDANGSLLTTINQVNPVWVRFSLSESDLAKLPAGRLGRAATADVQLILGDGTRYPAKGRLNFTATQIDPKLGTQQLRAEFENPGERLLPGQFVRVRLVGGQHENVYTVPQTAVMQTEKGHFVFVDDNGKAAIRPVTTGEWSGSNWVILSGLNSGDRVIVDNLLKLRPGSPVTIAPPAGSGPGGAAAPAGAPAPAPAAAASGGDKGATTAPAPAAAPANKAQGS
jgi:membrane fusion protein (multidrug efflux system)